MSTNEYDEPLEDSGDEEQFGPGPDDPMTYDAADDSLGRGRLLLILSFVIVFAAAGATYVVYQQGVRAGGRNAPPVIVAQEGPEKVAPEEPGGVEVPHQDKLVYDSVSGDDRETVEKLLPEPEEPVDLSDLRSSVSEDPSEGAVVADLGDEAQGVDTAGADVGGADISSVTDPDTNQPTESVADELERLAQAAEEELGLASPEDVGTPADAIKTPTEEPVAETPVETPSVGMSGPALSGTHVVQIASLEGADIATAQWDRFKGKYSSILDGKQPDIEIADLGSKGTWYRLRVGPFGSAEEARDWCNSLKSLGGVCLIKKL